MYVLYFNNVLYKTNVFKLKQLMHRIHVCLGCGGEITTPGIIKSPSTIDELTGNLGYPSNENCTWIIRALPGQVVRIVYVLYSYRLSKNTF